MAGQFSFGKEGPAAASHVAGCSVLLRARGEPHCDSHPLHTGTLALALSGHPFLCLLPSSSSSLTLQCIASQAPTNLSIYMLQMLEERSEDETWICSAYATKSEPFRSGAGEASLFSAGCAVLHA
jgi:hypothetical protein